jgi:hypothetical protein
MKLFKYFDPLKYRLSSVGYSHTEFVVPDGLELGFCQKSENQEYRCKVLKKTILTHTATFQFIQIKGINQLRYKSEKNNPHSPKGST